MLICFLGPTPSTYKHTISNEQTQRLSGNLEHIPDAILITTGMIRVGQGMILYVSQKGTWSPSTAGVRCLVGRAIMPGSICWLPKAYGEPKR